jgi:hypothetical protein
MGMACSIHGEKRNAFKVSVGKLEVNRPQRRPRCRWDDNIKMDLREVGWGSVQDRDQSRALVNRAVNLWVP